MFAICPMSMKKPMSPIYSILVFYSFVVYLLVSFGERDKVLEYRKAQTLKRIFH